MERVETKSGKELAMDFNRSQSRGQLSRAIASVIDPLREGIERYGSIAPHRQPYYDRHLVYAEFLAYQKRLHNAIAMDDIDSSSCGSGINHIAAKNKNRSKTIRSQGANRMRIHRAGKKG